MFGHNEIVGRKFFDDAHAGDHKNELLVTSMFVTLQGEGPFSGMPAFFVRLAKCNLACSFCDTYFDHGDWFGRYELAGMVEARIKQYYKGVVPHWADNGVSRRQMVLVITGGEPSLQKNLGLFIELMLEQFHSVQIESNGIVPFYDLDDRVTLVCSPKCSETSKRYLKPNPATLERADCLKFVVSADEGPYHGVPFWAIEWRERYGREIFVSPMNIYKRLPVKVGADGSLDMRSKVDEVISFWEPGLLDMERNQRNHEYAARYCIEHGLRLTLQTHLLASLA